jgi:hypothetical protein
MHAVQKNHIIKISFKSFVSLKYICTVCRLYEHKKTFYLILKTCINNLMIDANKISLSEAELISVEIGIPRTKKLA